MHVQNYSRKANSSKKGLGLVATLNLARILLWLSTIYTLELFFENISLNICS